MRMKKTDSNAGLQRSLDNTVWAFDLGKASIGEAVRRGTQFPWKASLLIPEYFAETRTAASRRRMMRTRLAHKAREKWLDLVMRKAGIEILRGRNYDSAGKWKAGEPADYRLEREFAPAEFKKTESGKTEKIIYPDGKAADGAPAKTKEDFSICYNSALLRIKLLRGDKMESWQIYKALHAAIQRRGYDPAIPWKNKQERKTDSRNKEDDEAGTQEKMDKYMSELVSMAPDKPQYHFPCFYDAWKMGLWDPVQPKAMREKTDCCAQSTRNQVIPRKLIENEITNLMEAAAKQYPKLAGKADFLLYGPTETAYASFDPSLRKKFNLKEGGESDWQGVLGQKIPRFDNRIIAKCALIPRMNVCKIREGQDGRVHPQSLIVAEAVFLMKLKNMRFQTLNGQGCLTAQQIGEIFNDTKRKKYGMTAAQWKKYCLSIGAKPLPGQYEEIAEPRLSGRSRFCRPALEILKRLILSGKSPQQAYQQEISLLNGNKNPLKGLVKEDLKWMLQMGDTWEGIYIPNQKLDALAQSSDRDCCDAIQKIISNQNDPIVRHRLSLFAQRLDFLSEKNGCGTPDYVALEFVREDFMGNKAKAAYEKFQRERASERAKAREEAAQAGAEERSAGLKMELLKAQMGECLYTCARLIPEKLDQYVIDHIVPRAKGGPDSILNYVLTTKSANDEKANRTPYEWLVNKPDFSWDGYVDRVKKRIASLRNKKVQLLTSPEATELVDRYTALAETAWISKLAQTIVSLRFGWKNGVDSEGKKRVIVVSGGLTGRIRRKYKLNSLLNPSADNEEEAEIKNRNDDRHHALDAMVISFLPNWARDVKYTGFFRFPNGVDRDLFAKEIATVMPRNICFEKPALAETIYGARVDQSENEQKIIVQRTELVSLGMKPISPGKSIFDLKYATKQTQSVRDIAIQKIILKFLESQPDEKAWKYFCDNLRLKQANGADGQRVIKVAVNVGEPTEYKDMSKDGTGAYRKALKGHKGQIVYTYPKTDKNGGTKETYAVRPIYAFESTTQVIEELRRKYGKSLQVKGIFQSGCMIQTDKEAFHAKKPLPPGKYILSTIQVSSSSVAKLKTINGQTYPAIPLYNIASLFAAGMRRIQE